MHTKKRNRLEQKKLNDLVYVQYNQRLQDRYARFQQTNFDPLTLEEIDDCKEWITNPYDCEDLVHEDDDLTWLDVEIATGIDEEEGPSTRLATKKRCLEKGKVVSIDEVDIDSDETIEGELPIEEEGDSESDD